VALSDTGLLVRYYFDEAASGTSPTSVADAGPNGYDLTDVNYGSGNLSWSEVSSGRRGLTSTSNTGTQRANYPIGSSGDAVRTAVSGATSLTWEIVVNYTSGSGSTGRLAAIQHRTSGASPAFGLTVITSTLTPYINSDPGAATANLSASGRVVVHLVFDSTQATPENRLKLYVNGALQSQSGSGIALNEAIAISGDYDIVHFNRNSSGNYDRSITGTIHYSALYSGAFDATRVDDHYDVLTLDDDTPGAPTQDLLPSLFTNTQTFYGPTITGGTATVAPPLLTNTQTFYSPTITGGAQQINASAIQFPTNGAGNTEIRMLMDPPPSRTSCTLVWHQQVFEQTDYYGGLLFAPQTSSFDGGRFTAMFVQYGATGAFNSAGQRTAGAPSPIYEEIAGLGNGTSNDFIASPESIVGAGNQESYLVDFDVWVKKAVTIETIGGTTVRHTFYVDLEDTSKTIIQEIPLSQIDLQGNDPGLYYGTPPWITGFNAGESAYGRARGFKFFSGVLDLEDILTEANTESNTPATSAGLSSVYYTNINPTSTDVADKSGEGNDFTWTTANRPTDYAFSLVLPDTFTNTNTFFSPTVEGEAAEQTLSPGLLTNTSTFYAATVSPGGVSVAPGLLTNAQMFYAPTVGVGGVSLAPQLLTNGQTFYGPTVVRGAVTLQAPLLTNSSEFFAAEVTPGAVSLSPGLLTNVSEFYSPIVSGGVVLQPGLLVNEQTFFAPAVTAGEVEILPPLLTNTQIFYGPLVVSGTVVSPPLLENAQNFFAPTVSRGAVTLAPGLLSNAQQFYAPTVTQEGEKQFLLPALFMNESEFYAPAVSFLADELYPLAGLTQDWPITGSQTFPLAGQRQTFPLE
jgi:hypothetical protein